ncbi:MAG: hypothetical protein OEY22_05940 [Candidatus Bathyarchaeota archaeon]|nr:hypothetical protein [Candidatus Bathyarchaeota archaeon]MDH5788317.1 hypothetical protein [Candidatus Bathyarchaeota archaeon]
MNRKRLYWILLTVVPAALVATGIVTRLSLSMSQSPLDLIRITNIQIKTGSRPSGWFHLYIPLESRIMDAAFFDVQLIINVENSKASDSSDLELAVKIVFHKFTVASQTQMIETLRAQETKTITIYLYSVADLYLFNRLGYDKGPVFFATLYSNNEVLDEKTIDYATP